MRSTPGTRSSVGVSTQTGSRSSPAARSSPGSFRSGATTTGSGPNGATSRTRLIYPFRTRRSRSSASIRRCGWTARCGLARTPCSHWARGLRPLPGSAGGPARDARTPGFGGSRGYWTDGPLRARPRLQLAALRRVGAQAAPPSSSRETSSRCRRDPRAGALSRRKPRRRFRDRAGRCSSRSGTRRHRQRPRP